MTTMRAWKRDIDPASETEEIFLENGDTLPARFNVDSRDIKVGKKIGKGVWTVRKAKWRGLKVAVKKFNVNNTFHSVSLTSREVNRMLSLRHPNVLKLLGFFLTTQKEQVLECTMIMELMDWDLEKYLGRRPLSDAQVVYVAAEVARGMSHIHKMGCFHRDLKPKNILLRKSVVTGSHVDVKIADFGSSELMGAGDINRTSGTTGYKAPEQFDSTLEFFPDKADMFGFGALCFKLLTGKQPYESHMNVQEAIKKIDRAAISQRNLPEGVVQIIWECLDKNPVSRPDFDEISLILDRALLAIWEKMARSLPPSTSLSMHPNEPMSKGVQGQDRLESILHSMGLSRKHEVQFIPPEELSVIGLRGQGAIASVYPSKWLGIQCATKVFHERDGPDSSYPMDYSFMGRNYFQTFPKLFHKNIVTFMGYSVTLDNRISIILELLAMDLSKALRLRDWRRRNPHLTIQKGVRIMKEIAERMKYLHDQGVVHGDLRPHNVVVSALNTSDTIVKLTGFANHPGLCTVNYAAPEILKNKKWIATNIVDTKKSDVYSFGVLCLEIVRGIAHIEDNAPSTYRIAGDYSEAILRGESPPIPDGPSPEMEDLIKSCWNEDPEARPNFSEICESLSRILQSCGRQNNPKCFAQRCFW